MTTAVLTAAQGAVLSIKNSTFQALVGVHNGPNGPGWVPEIIEARYHGSNSVFRKVTVVKPQPVTFDLYYDSSDTNHALMLTNAKGKVRTEFTLAIQDTGAEVYGFFAYVEMVLKAPVEGFNVYSCQLYIDGDVGVS
jgi:hypothetical protein